MVGAISFQADSGRSLGFGGVVVKDLEALGGKGFGFTAYGTELRV